MHSSRMRTGRSLTIFRSLKPRGVYLVPGGVYLVLGGCTWSGGVYLVPWGVYLVRGVYLVWGGTWSRGVYLVLGGCTPPGPGNPPPPGTRYPPRPGTPPGPGTPPTGPGTPPQTRYTWSWRVYLVPGGCTWSRGGVPGQVPPPVNRMTNRCKNITLAKTSFRPVKMNAQSIFEPNGNLNCNRVINRRC